MHCSKRLLLVISKIGRPSYLSYQRGVLSAPLSRFSSWNEGCRLVKHLRQGSPDCTHQAEAVVTLQETNGEIQMRCLQTVTSQE